MIKSKKAQMKIQQMAFMLIAVTLFFILAGLFIITIRFSGLRESAELLDERNAVLLASKLADSPEFSCESAFGKPRTNCIDTDKLMALKSRIATGEYSGFWSVDGIEVRWVFPTVAKGTKECTMENYPSCDKITLVVPEGGTGKDRFVSLCRKELSDENEDIYDKCELGSMIIFYNENE